mmetsp:Transcript_40603/g.73095  ORF Transcript_40603/g.73095 Transcript_40603/m.73095 type:complete len:96 (-) Transcript_40603:524-811(-)
MVSAVLFWLTSMYPVLRASTNWKACLQSAERTDVLSCGIGTACEAEEGANKCVCWFIIGICGSGPADSFVERLAGAVDAASWYWTWPCGLPAPDG